jgi:Rap1a immunity proteins
MKKLLLTTTLLGALMSSAQAVDLDGNALLRECSRDATRFCQGFALGIAWAGPQYCKPEGLMGSDHTAVVMRYLRQQSGRLHLPAQNLVAEAYAAAWPCKNQVARTPQQIPPSPPTPPSSDDEAFKDSSEMDVMVAAGIAITMAYVRCGGDITPEQKEGINTQLALIGPMIDVFSKKFKSSKCSEINAAYRTFINGVSSLGPRS